MAPNIGNRRAASGALFSSPPGHLEFLLSVWSPFFLQSHLHCLMSGDPGTMAHAQTPAPQGVKICLIILILPAESPWYVHTFTQCNVTKKKNWEVFGP